MQTFAYERGFIEEPAGPILTAADSPPSQARPQRPVLRRFPRYTRRSKSDSESQGISSTLSEPPNPSSNAITVTTNDNRASWSNPFEGNYNPLSDSRNSLVFPNFDAPAQQPPSGSGSSFTVVEATTITTQDINSTLTGSASSIVGRQSSGATTAVDVPWSEAICLSDYFSDLPREFQYERSESALAQRRSTVSSSVYSQRERANSWVQFCNAVAASEAALQVTAFPQSKNCAQPSAQKAKRWFVPRFLAWIRSHDQRMDTRYAEKADLQRRRESLARVKAVDEDNRARIQIHREKEDRRNVTAKLWLEKQKKMQENIERGKRQRMQIFQEKERKRLKEEKEMMKAEKRASTGKEKDKVRKRGAMCCF